MLITLTHINNNLIIRNEILDSLGKQEAKKGNKQESKKTNKQERNQASKQASKE